MSAFILRSFPYANDTSTLVGLSAGRGERKHGVIAAAAAGADEAGGSRRARGSCHDDEPPFNYEHKQSDLDEPCWSRMG